MPVLLALSSWNPREPLDAWLVRRITEDYPFLTDAQHYGPDATAKLVQTHRVLPILDGLDEMPTAWQASAITALNDAVGGARPVVLTCRSDEYQAAVAATGTPLARAAVVELEPVTATDIATYLPAGQLDGHAKWAPVIDHLRTHPDGPLATALSTPLMVYLARTIYTRPGSNPTELCDTSRFTNRSTIEDHLLDGFLPAAYQHQPATTTQSRGRTYTADQARRWLSFLARHLDRLGTPDLAWWQLPAAIPRWRLLFSLVFIFALMTAFAYSITAVVADKIYYPPWYDFLLYVGAYGPMLGLVAGLIATRTEATIPRPNTSSGTRRAAWRAIAAAVAYSMPTLAVVLVVANSAELILPRSFEALPSDC